MKRKFNAQLTAKSIRGLIDDLRQYNKNLEKKALRISELLALEGLKECTVQVLRYEALFSGELLSSLHIEDHFGVFFVVADSEHAAFVEFGTGWVGADHPYKYPLPQGVSWDYVVGQQITANVAKGIYGWFYRGDDGQIHFTEGMKSRPFMHNTFVHIQKLAIRTVRQVFDEP